MHDWQSVSKERSSASELLTLEDKLSVIEEKLEFAEKEVEQLRELNTRADEKNNYFKSKVIGNFYTVQLVNFININCIIIQILDYEQKTINLEDQLKQQQVTACSYKHIFVYST